MSTKLMQPLTHRLRELEIKQTPTMLLISIATQTLVLASGEAELCRYSISTSHKPPSCRERSFGTPTGLHRIAKKIGGGAALGAVFRGREEIGQRYWELPEREQAANLITSRILWLEGMEPGLNKGEAVDSYDRYIYIHGTNHEGKIGEPASGGCIQLANAEMIALYERCNTGDLVYIA